MNSRWATFVLVRSQLEENIGAVARAMMNFGFTNLRLVEPKCDHLSKKALALACKAVNTLSNATIFNSIQEATHDINLLYAFSARSRSVDIESDSLNCLAQRNDLKSGFMFGPENSGLSNHDLSLADKIIHINTSEIYSSLNLSHSVAIACYELSRNNAAKENDNAKIATKGEMNTFYGHLEKELINKNFFRTTEKIPTAMLNIKNMFKKGSFSPDEIKTLHGIVKALVSK